jgi:hypothetical protein
MAINFPMLLYLPAFQRFARPVTFHPIVSQPGAPSFQGRAIYDTERLDLEALDGSRFSGGCPTTRCCRARGDVARQGTLQHNADS